VRRGLCAAAAALPLCAAIAEALAADIDGAAIRAAAGSVVSVLPVWPGGRMRAGEPEGSGVVIADGYLVLTADHVLGPATSAFVRSADGEVRRAEIVGRDAATDLALLKLAAALPPIAVGDEPEPADEACAIGNGFGLGLSIACGRVSAVHRADTGFNRIEDFVQTDAAVNPGMSGGALVDGEGRLIGLLSAIFTRTSDANIGVNFAVSAALALKVAADLADDGKARHGRPALRLRPWPPLGEEGRQGGEIVAVEAGSPEARAGLRPGDVIIEAGGRRVRRPGGYAAALALHEAGEAFDVLVERDGRPVRIGVDFSAGGN
jgi:S1-C subfamily serine protease